MSSLLLAGAVAASWLLVRQPMPGSLPETEAGAPPGKIGYYAHDATVVATQENGSPLYELNAREILHYPHDDSVTLRDVDLSYHRETEVPWTLQSDVGRLPVEARVIELTGNVRVVSHPENESERIILTTTRLEIRPYDDLAVTDAPVRIQLGQHILSSTGMKAYLKEERLELQSNVYGRFTP